MWIVICQSSVHDLCIIIFYIFTLTACIPGDVVVGTEQVDNNWWQGRRCDGSDGIFPITHVQELEVLPSGGSPKISQTSLPAQKNVSSKVGQNGIIAKARATLDLSAQLDDELSFYAGDVIEITEVVDSDFAIGTVNGRTGSFPMAFVEVFEGTVNAGDGSSKRVSKFDWWKEEAGAVAENNNECVLKDPYFEHPKPAATEPHTHDTDPVKTKLSEKASQQPTVESSNSVRESQTNSGISGAAGSGRVESSSVSATPAVNNDHGAPVQGASAAKPFWMTHKRNNSYNQENTHVTPYGKTLFPFIAENPNELTFFDQEIVTLIRHVDDQWMEGEIDGKRGIFPSSYVEVIVDCPYDYQGGSTTSSTTTQKSELNKPKRLSQSESQVSVTDFSECYALVLYNFSAESPQDLDLKEGDTVTILRKVDENWYEAKDDDGRVGYCPVNFLQIVVGEPPKVGKTPVSSVKADDKGSSDASQGSVIDNRETRAPSPAIPPRRSASPSVVISPARENSKETEETAKPKPQLKPKPALKPKPTKGTTRSVSFAADTPSPQESPKQLTASVSADLANGLDQLQNVTDKETNRTKKPDKPAMPKRPQVPHYTGVTAKPVSKAVSVDSSLDDLIQAELKVAKRGSSERSKSIGEQEHDNRSPTKVTFQPENGAVRFDRQGSSGSPFPAFGGSSVTLNSQSGMTRVSSQPSPPTRPVGSSLFYTESAQAGLQEAQSKSSTSRPRPVPSRPPRPPPSVSSGVRRSLSSGDKPPQQGITDMGPRPVPSRPAPPRPSQLSGPLGGSTEGNLMEFSPEQDPEPGFGKCLIHVLQPKVDTAGCP